MAVTKHFYGDMALTVGLAIALASCNGTVGQENTESDTGPVEAAQSPEQAPAEERMNKKDQIAFSVEDLSARLDVETSAVTYLGAVPVMWRSGALGCPEPGMNYTQALVPGIWISLRVGKTPYRYHAVPGGQPLYCPDERAEPPVTGAGAD